MQVPSYAAFIKERFERCLDLYLCPRVRQNRVHIQDPKSLLPTLPKPRDLQPFPHRLAKRFLGHTAAVSGLLLEQSFLMPKDEQTLSVSGATRVQAISTRSGHTCCPACEGCEFGASRWMMPASPVVLECR